MSLLNRREFSQLCAAFGSLTAASAIDAASGTSSAAEGRTVKFRDGAIVPALGQGSAGLGRENALKLPRKKRCGLVFPSE